jgi:tetratricopeptide (TPR) repeat protein
MTHSGLRTFATLGLLAGLAALNACTYWNGELERLADQSGRNFKIDPDRPYKYVDLRDVQESPSSFKFAYVQFQAIMNKKDAKIFVTLYGTFRQEDYMSFSAWPADAAIWEEDQWVKSVPTLYMRKDNEGLQTLIDAERYALVQIKGRVANDFEQLPFIEVHYIEVVDPFAYSEETLADLRGAMAALSDKKPAQTIERLERALEGPLHGRARAMAHFQLGKLYEERGDFDKAAMHFEAVLWDDPDNVAAWEGWERNVKASERKRSMP